MNWLKLHHDARNDAKLETLADDEFRVWHRLLIFASEQADRGVVSYAKLRLLAVEVSRGDIDLLERTLQSLVDLEIIEWEEGSARFLNWEKRQNIKPSAQAPSVAERVRQCRERKKMADCNATVADGNTLVTPCNTPVTKCNAIDIEEEKRRELPPVSPPLGGDVPETAKRFDQPEPALELEPDLEDDPLDSDHEDAEAEKAAYPADFCAFWTAYPRRVGKKAAFRVWQRSRDKPKLAAVLAAIESAKRSEQWQRDGGQYIPHPATWLNQGRWDDETNAAGAGGPAAQGPPAPVARIVTGISYEEAARRAAERRKREAEAA